MRTGLGLKLFTTLYELAALGFFIAALVSGTVVEKIACALLTLVGAALIVRAWRRPNNDSESDRK